MSKDQNKKSIKQYTTPEQTAKLIELLFEKPQTIVDKYYDFDAEDYKEVNHYSIGELIEMLPKDITNDALPDRFGVYIDHNKMWVVEYSNILGELYSTYRAELIDALYDMVVKLKQKGVI